MFWRLLIIVLLFVTDDVSLFFITATKLKILRSVKSKPDYIDDARMARENFPALTESYRSYAAKAANGLGHS